MINLVTTMESIYSFVDIIQSNISVKVNVLEETIKRIFTQVNIYGSFDRNIPTDTYADG